MSKFKIGDEVKVIKLIDTAGNMSRYLDKKGVIRSIEHRISFPIKVSFLEMGSMNFQSEELELVEPDITF